MLKSGYRKGVFFLLLFLILGLGSLAFFQRNGTSEGATIILEEDGKEILRIEDYRNKAEGIYPFRFEKGEADIEIRDGKVRMLEMDRVICPEGICSDTGYTDSAFKPIVCLPNRLILTVGQPDRKSPDVMGG